MGHPIQARDSSTSDQRGEKYGTVQIIPCETQNETHEELDGILGQTKSTLHDAADMQRIGRTQQFVRRFRLFSVASFAALATASWELGLFMITPGLEDGGRPMLIYSIIWAFVGFGPMYLSMAEMASMAPVAGSQYHWVSEFAPEGYQRILSYLTGWTTTLAWQSGNALGVFLVGTLIQSIISINNPDYTFPAWHATLLVAAATAIAFLGNTFGAKVLHQWQNAMFIVHVLALFALIIPIWVKVPKIPSEQVWLEFDNNGGWPNMAITVLVGQVIGIYSQVGVDTAAHMSEDTKDASRAVPRAMLMIYVVNFIVLLPVMVTLCYHMPSITDALDDPTLYPAIYVLRQVGSPGYIIGILVVTLVLLTCSNITYLAAVSRDSFAFARDEGLPFSEWISHVDPKRRIPQNACIATSAVSIGLALLYLGSPVAFYAITSLCTVAFLQGYCVSIGCVLWRRIKYPETLPPARFSLGRWGIPINAFAVVYSFWCFFWTFWPQTFPVTASNFNWALAIFLGTVAVAVIDFVFRARHRYHGPVKLIRGRFENAA